MLTLDHEGLDAYQTARELSREVNRITMKARRRLERRDILNQIHRAASSVPLNIAEGSGEELPGRRAYFYRIARASAVEVAAALDHMVDVDMLAEEATTEAKALVVRIVAMLYKMTRAAKTPESFPPLPRARGPRKN